MKRVTGVGGIFFKSKDPEKLYGWYEKHLGVGGSGAAPAIFHWREKEDPEKAGMTVWSIFPQASTYLDPSASNFMINYRVEDLDALLEALRAEGVQIDDKQDESEYGKFAWITDLDGNRIELWEPPPGS